MNNSLFIMMAKTIIITAEEKKRIASMYERSKVEIEEDIIHIKEWLSKQLHLPQDEDDLRIRNMLLLNKCSLEKTKAKLDSYYSLKHLVPEFYENREPLNSSMMSLMDNVAFFPLPRLTPECHRIYINSHLTTDLSEFYISMYYKIIFTVFDLQLMDDLSLGDHFIIDFENCTMAHIGQFNPTKFKKAYTLLTKAYSDRIKGLHLLNLPAAANFVISIFHSILSPKLANRVFIHKNLESLHKYIPNEILPFEYGGKAGAFNDLYGEWKMYVRGKNDWLKLIGDKKSDEAKRVGDQLNPDLFGVCGSFRKLNVD